MRRLSHRVIGAGFYSWSAWSAESRRHRDIVSRAAMRLGNRATGGAFRAWVVWSRETRRARVTVSRVLTRLRNRVTSAAFVSWEAHATENRRLKSLLKTVLVRFHHACIGSAFAGWVDAIDRWREEKKQAEHAEGVIRRVLMRMQSVSLSFAFDGWWNGMVKRKQLIRVAGVIIGRIMHALLARCLTNWIDFVESVRRVNSFMIRAGQRMHGQTLASTWQAWREYHYDIVQKSLDTVKEQAREAAAIRVAKHWSQWRIAKCFRSWHEFSKNAARIKRVLRSSIQRIRLGCTTRCFAAWFEHTKETIVSHSRLKRGLQWLINRVVASAFLTWVERTEERILREQRVLKMLQRWSNAGAAYVFDRWRNHWEQMAKARYCLRRVLHRVSWQCMQRWRNLVEMEKHHRSVMTKVVLRMQQLLLASVWDRWSRITWQHSQLRKIISRIRLSSLHHAMNTWRHGVQISAEQGRRLTREQEITVIHRIYSNQIANIATFVTARWQRKMLLKAWYTWRLASHGYIKHEVQADKYVFHLRRRDAALVVSSCFYLWLRQYQLGLWQLYYADYTTGVEEEDEPAADVEEERATEWPSFGLTGMEALPELRARAAADRPEQQPPRSVWLDKALEDARGVLDQAAGVEAPTARYPASMARLSRNSQRTASGQRLTRAGEQERFQMAALGRWQEVSRVTPPPGDGDSSEGDAREVQHTVEAQPHDEVEEEERMAVLAKRIQELEVRAQRADTCMMQQIAHQVMDEVEAEAELEDEVSEVTNSDR